MKEREVKKLKTALIGDSETANGLECPLPYDWGYVIVDYERWEILVERSYVIAEIFLDKQLMSSAYYSKKIPLYEKELKEGKRELRSIATIKRQMQQDMKKYNCNIVCAYNLGFDKRACNNDCRYITGSKYRWFFPYGVEYVDIWHMACSSFLRSKWYIKWAIKNGYVSEAGNVKTNAEVAYRYITKQKDFEEKHMGIDDVKIEMEIMKKVLTGRMKYETSINHGCWRIPQKVKKQMECGCP